MNDDVECTRCGETHWWESSYIIHCEACEQYFCQSCCWNVLPIQYKKAHKPVEDEKDYDDAICDWCKWDVSWEDKEIAKFIVENVVPKVS